MDLVETIENEQGDVLTRCVVRKMLQLVGTETGKVIDFLPREDQIELLHASILYLFAVVREFYGNGILLHELPDNPFH